jgi:hypothetical protein
MLILQVALAVAALRNGWNVGVLVPFGLAVLTPQFLSAVPVPGLPPDSISGLGEFVCLVALLIMNCMEAPWAPAPTRA